MEGSRRGQGGVKEGSRRGQGGVKEGSRRGQGGVKEGSRRGQGGVKEGQRGVKEGSNRGSRSRVDVIFIIIFCEFNIMLEISASIAKLTNCGSVTCTISTCTDSSN